MTLSAIVGGGPSAGRLARPSAIWIVVIVLLLVGLPLAMWADLRELSSNALTRQSEEFSRIINDVRNFYAQDVVARVIAADGKVHTSSKFREEPGAIPIPATFSIELGRLIGENGNVGYRFVSDFPFAGREPHVLDEFETNALASASRRSDQADRRDRRLAVQSQRPPRHADHHGRDLRQLPQ